MTPPRWRSRFRSGAPASGAALAILIAAGVAAIPRDAAAQACCVGTGLVTPGRLRTFENRALGMQMRARSAEFKSYDAEHEIVPSMRDDVVQWLTRATDEH